MDPWPQSLHLEQAKQEIKFKICPKPSSENLLGRRDVNRPLYLPCSQNPIVLHHLWFMHFSQLGKQSETRVSFCYYSIIVIIYLFFYFNCKIFCMLIG